MIAGAVVLALSALGAVVGDPDDDEDLAAEGFLSAEDATSTTSKATPTTERRTTTTTERATTTTKPTTTTTTEPPTTTTTEPPTTTTADPFANESVSQRNARRAASDYLRYMSFSRSGLIQQLEFEGYPNADATYAADAVGADWNEQAAKSAASYLDYMAFSRQGLIDQLIFEGFTREQAEYGVNSTGL